MHAAQAKSEERAREAANTGLSRRLKEAESRCDAFSETVMDLREVCAVGGVGGGGGGTLRMRRLLYGWCVSCDASCGTAMDLRGMGGSQWG